MRAYARRVAAGDVDALADMTGLADELDEAITQAVATSAKAGYSGPRSRPASASPDRRHNNVGPTAVTPRQVHNEKSCATIRRPVSSAGGMHG